MVISATVDFEHTTYLHRGGRTTSRTDRFRLIRTALEQIEHWEDRRASTVELLRMGHGRTVPQDDPESEIETYLPKELREVFFTDGDRALSFIEADVSLSTKRKRVRDAIRSLLGLGVLDKMLPRVRRYGVALNKRAKAAGRSSDLHATLERLEQIEDTWDQVNARHQDASEQFAAFDTKLQEVALHMEEALRAGDREDLARAIRSTKQQIATVDSQIEDAATEHSQLFCGELLALSLVRSLTDDALNKLDQLKKRGRIPSATVPVLQECISEGVCICGESLASKTGGGRRYKHIRSLIDEAKRADELKELITGLYFRTTGMRGAGSPPGAAWITRFRRVEKKRLSLRQLRSNAGRQLQSLGVKEKAIPDVNIQGLRTTRRQYSEQRDRFLSEKMSCEAQLNTLQRELVVLKAKRKLLLKARKKGAIVLAQLEVASDVEAALTRAYEWTTTEEVREVSTGMNSIFLEMIGVDKEQGAIIRRAEVSQQCDISVFGPEDRRLDPDQDLNGASRRALTLAFILSLARVSEVEAPNVIDTPLGMTAGYVRHSMLRTAVRGELAIGAIPYP